MARIAVVLVALLFAPILTAQQPASRFEVATIKPSAVDSRAPDNSEVQPKGHYAALYESQFAGRTVASAAAAS